MKHIPLKDPFSFLPARLPALVVLVILLVPIVCAAQSSDGNLPRGTASPDSQAEATSRSEPSITMALQARSVHATGVWVAGSFATGGPIGNVSKAQLGLFGLRYERLLVPTAPDSPNGPSLTYMADLLPVLLLSIPPGTVSGPPSDETSRGLDTYGIGLNPAGLRLTYRVTKRVQPFVEGSTGLRYFGQRVPTGWGKHVNFTFDVGAGVQVVLTSNLILTAGYRYHHLSNGFRGQINPGVDANLFHLDLAISQ